ncbi:glycosyltransferase family 4 protein [Rhodanobacter thiooxydans]|uniref:glycosyltransferase family 4 protein n=1 Tax=Rhodanobacter thiooxydans TaxID=416169 RepID=UPI000D3B6F4B|nr:glycosyltransferase family 4 protein [Rhodanobacter thiooxydans]
MIEGQELGNARAAILLVTRNLPPLRGGMERLNRHIAIELASGFRVLVVGPNGCRAHLPATVDVHEAPVRPLWRFLARALLLSLSRGKKARPRIVLAGSGLTAPIAVITAGIMHARSAVYAHGLDLVTPNLLYRALWLPFLRRCDVCIVNSRNTARLARQVGIRQERITVIHPGVELPVETGNDGCAAPDFRQRHGLQACKVMLSVGRLTPRKGIPEFVRQALPRIVSACPDVVLVIIGDEAPNALQGSGLGAGERLMECARELGLERHIRMLGACEDAELAIAYDVADLCIFPVRALPGDVEGFGMVAVEAAAHGLPTVAFDVGGVGDAVADGCSGRLVPAGDYDMFVEQVVQTLQIGRTVEVSAACRRFAAGFEWRKFGARLSDRLRQLVSNDGSLP